MVEKLNRDFVAVEVNITDHGFPEEVEALKPWKKAYETNWRHQFGFATSVVIGPWGKGALGTSGCGHTWEWDTSINYDPAKYDTFLDQCLDRFRRVNALILDQTRTAERKEAEVKAIYVEIVKSIAAANRCSPGTRRRQD